MSTPYEEPLDDRTIEQLEELGFDTNDPEQVREGLNYLTDLAEDREDRHDE